MLKIGGGKLSISRVTRKGQITIPKDVRDSLGILESDYVVIVADGDKAIISRLQTGKLADLKGKLPATRPFPSIDIVRSEVAKNMGQNDQDTTY